MFSYQFVVRTLLTQGWSPLPPDLVFGSTVGPVLLCMKANHNLQSILCSNPPKYPHQITPKFISPCIQVFTELYLFLQHSYNICISGFYSMKNVLNNKGLNGTWKREEMLVVFSFQGRNISLSITNEQAPKPGNLTASCRDITQDHEAFKNPIL